MMRDQHNRFMLPHIESRIQMIRGLRVMLDVDLNALYEVANCDYCQNLTDTPKLHIKGRMAQRKQC